MDTSTNDLAAGRPSATWMREKNISECGYPYKFSIIMSVYNVEKYFQEAIESVFEQDIGFTDSAQIILVDDGSTDQSGIMCDEYAKQHPDNIVVIHKDNGGLSSARNAGLKYVTGKYFNFLDPDDKLSTDTLRIVYDFFEKHRDETDIVTIPIYLFDGASGQYWQNWKFDRGSRVIDLLREPLNTCMHAASSFFKNERKDDLSFDPNLATGEDMKGILAYLYPMLTLGVISDVKYFYRRRADGSSIIQTAQTKKAWYLGYTHLLLQWAFDFYTEKLGCIPGFVQYTLLCDYQWRILDKADPSQTLSAEEVREYKEQIYSALKLFDDRYILELNELDRDHKLFLLSKKYGDDLKEVRMERDRSMCAKNPDMFLESSALCKIDFLSLDDGNFSIEGWTRILGFEKPEDIKVFLKVNDQFILCDRTEKDHNTYFFDDLMSLGIGFKSVIKLDTDTQNHQIEIYVEINGHKVIKKNIHFSEFCPVRDFPINGYFYNNGSALTYRDSAFHISACGKGERLRREVRFLKELWGIKERAAQRAVFRRILYYVTAPFQRKKRWIISDRVNKADDNGEALFSYMSQHKDDEVKCCFAIAPNSPDYKRLKKTGTVIPFRGWRYKLYCLQGACIVSSHNDDFSRLPLWDDTKYYADLFHKTRFIFLQHGITKDDLSGWLRRDKKNINLFITATWPEYRSILEYDYGYTEKQVKLMGFPRYDLLTHDEKKYITIMPTWRAYLLSHFNGYTGLWGFKGDFSQSRFYQFYRALLNHGELLKTAAKHGYTLRFMPHPAFAAGLKMMNFGDHVKLLDTSTAYRKVFAESDMIVTDYSSVAFDFAYLRKPLLYCHFDAGEFFNGKHNYTRGYFDYERDGFGEVAYDLEAAAQYMIEYIKNGCQLKDKYLGRIEDTFAFNDRNNCERVYQAIKELDRE